MTSLPLDDDARLRLRARLLEFLKFRVLASQEAFFEAWQPACGSGTPPQQAATTWHQQTVLPDLDLVAFRAWLHPLWPAAARLSDADLRQSLEQAHHLYVDPAPGQRPD